MSRWPMPPPLDTELTVEPLDTGVARAYRGFHEHAFPGCFGCGPERHPGDGLRIFPGPGAAGVQCTWTPDESLANAAGEVLPWFVWAALDCPGGWAFMHAGPRPAVLGELAVSIDEAVRAYQEYVIGGWQIDQAGRKHHCGSALYHGDGRVVVRALATWVEIGTDHPAAAAG